MMWASARLRTVRGEFVLNGEKTLVSQGDSADKLIVSGRVKGERRDRNGIGLFLVDADAPGVSRRGYPTPGWTAGGGNWLRRCPRRARDVLGSPDGALPAIEWAVDKRSPRLPRRLSAQCPKRSR